MKKTGVKRCPQHQAKAKARITVSTNSVPINNVQTHPAASEGHRNTLAAADLQPLTPTHTQGWVLPPAPRDRLLFPPTLPLMSLPRATAWPCPAVPAPGQPDLAGCHPASADPGLPSQSQGTELSLLRAPDCSGISGNTTLQDTTAPSSESSWDEGQCHPHMLHSTPGSSRSPRSRWQMHLGFKNESRSPHPRTLQTSLTLKT